MISKSCFLRYSGGSGVGGRPDHDVDWELYVTGFAYIVARGYDVTGNGFIFDYGFIDEFDEAGVRHHERREDHSSDAALRLQSRR